MVGRRAHRGGLLRVLRDLKTRLLPGQRIQLTTDGPGAHPVVVDALWGSALDYAQQIKEYNEAPADERRRYSPARCTVVEKKVLSGDPQATTSPRRASSCRT